MGKPKTRPSAGFAFVAADERREGELDKNSTCAKIAQVQTEGQRRVARNTVDPLLR